MREGGFDYEDEDVQLLRELCCTPWLVLKYDVIDSVKAVSGRVNNVIHACSKFKSDHRLRLPNMSKKINTMKMRRKYYVELDNQADAKGKEIDDMKKNNKDKLAKAKHVKGYEIKFGKYILSLNLTTTKPKKD